MSNLKPCPIPGCGSIGHTINHSEHFDEFVRCEHCSFICDGDDWQTLPRPDVLTEVWVTTWENPHTQQSYTKVSATEEEANEVDDTFNNKRVDSYPVQGALKDEHIQNLRINNVRCDACGHPAEHAYCEPCYQSAGARIAYAENQAECANRLLSGYFAEDTDCNCPGWEPSTCSFCGYRGPDTTVGPKVTICRDCALIAVEDTKRFEYSDDVCKKCSGIGVIAAGTYQEEKCGCKK